MKNINFSNSQLTGQFLIATPSLVGSCFEKAVIYMCSHNEKGAMGLLVNRSIGSVKMSDLLSEAKVENSLEDVLVHFGGPVDLTKGFVLHSSEYSNNNTSAIKDGVSITADIGVIKDITKGSGPQNSIVAFGYAGWGAGQLESEVLSNTWISAPANNDIIFKIDNKNKWEAAAKIVGIDLAHYSSVAGHA